MSIDGRFIKYLSKELNQELISGRIQKISQISHSDFLFIVRVQAENKNLYLSLSTANSRIHLIDKNLNQFDQPGGFCMFLRKHIEGGTIQSINSLNNDRIIEIKTLNVNDLGDQTNYYLFIELFGRYANLIITDNNKQILNAYKHIHPFEDIDRTIVNGAHYLLPNDNKIDPEDLVSIEKFFSQDNLNYRDIINALRGISPLLAQHIIKEAHHKSSEMYLVYKEILNQPINPTLELKDRSHFYYLDIFQNPKRHFKSISALLEFYYYEQTDKEKVKQIHKYLSQFSKNQVNKYKNKLENLSKDLKKAKQNDIYRMKADLLIQDQHKIQATDYEYIGFSYELNQELSVELDRKKSVIENANQYYKKYKKLKSAIEHLNKQIILTKHELNYFINLKDQINNNYNYQDLDEIKEELITLKYIAKKKSKKTNKAAKLNYDTYIFDEQTKIYVGKNNLQNNYLTHKLAHKNDMWFHVQNQSGSHVIVHGDSLTEETIRHAANLAAYFSKSKMSGSVAVDYTLVKNIKKIPGELGSYVSYSNQKTIYIDPDETKISELKKLK